MDLPLLQKELEIRLSVIGDTELREVNPELQLQQLQEVSEKIDAWRELNRGQMDKRLLHFLDNYSLDKALDFVRDNNNSKCG